jgi:DNA-binding NarL/FixJ family response regulator
MASGLRCRITTVNVLLIDDHPLFREGLALLLQPMLEGLRILQAGTCEEAFALLEETGAADLALIDLAMPGTPGLQGIAWMRERFPQTSVVALSSSDDRDSVVRAIDAGAMGFIPKSSTPAVLISALRLVLARGIYLPAAAFLGAGRPPLAAEPALSGQAVAASAAPPGALQAAAGPSPADLGLTPRQSDVLYLILQGKPAKLIERELQLAASTVKSHTSAVLRALNVTTRTQAVVAAGRIGLRFGPRVA